ncbi:MAG: hypothetical protein M1828_007500 [Chrysothrix sp. TS-e1954]|nr:MAG: hypothetical protein M1828_007500 [Chrysothrix sp. TS-e1954]
MTQDHPLYAYSPNVGAAILYVVLFGLATLLHSYQVFRRRTLFFIPLIIGSIMETIGYGCRFQGHKKPGELSAYIVQDLFLILAPIFFAATLYMAFARIIRSVRAEHLALLRPSRITKTFVCADILCFLTQASGGGLLVRQDASAQSTGRAVFLVGLVLQILIFGVFIAMCWNFYARLSTSSGAPESEWKRHMAVLFAGSAGILVRNTVRVVEFAQGFYGYIEGHEVFLYVFDAAPMLAVVSIMIILHSIRQGNVVVDDTYVGGVSDTSRGGRPGVPLEGLEKPKIQSDSSDV